MKLGDKSSVGLVAVIAGKGLRPGQFVIFNSEGYAIPTNKKSAADGVVDPFLSKNVYAGELFWLVTHKNINPSVIGPCKLIERMAEYAERMGLTYNQLIKDLTRYYLTRKKLEYKGHLTCTQLKELNSFDIWRSWEEITGNYINLLRESVNGRASKWLMSMVYHEK